MIYGGKHSVKLVIKIRKLSLSIYAISVIHTMPEMAIPNTLRNQIQNCQAQAYVMQI